MEKNRPNVLNLDKTKPREDSVLFGSALDFSWCHPHCPQAQRWEGPPTVISFYSFHRLIAETPGQAGPGERLDAVVSPWQRQGGGEWMLCWVPSKQPRGEGRVLFSADDVERVKQNGEPRKKKKLKENLSCKRCRVTWTVTCWGHCGSVWFDQWILSDIQGLERTLGNKSFSGGGEGG